MTEDSVRISWMDQVLAMVRDDVALTAAFYNGLRGNRVPRRPAAAITAAYIQAKIMAANATEEK